LAAPGVTGDSALAYLPEEATPDRANDVKGFPPSYFERLHRALNLVRPRCQALDLGTGRGEIARGLAQHGASVIAIDSNSGLLDQARAVETPENAGVRYADASAEQTGLDDESLDLVIAGQSWHAFDADAVALEAHRVLRPRCHLVIAHYAWQSLPRNVVEATEDLIVQIDPDWRTGGTNGLYSEWYPRVRAAGFGEHQTFLHDVDVVFNHEGWRAYVGRRLAESFAQSDCKKLDDMLAEELVKRFAGDYLVAPHRAFSYIAQKN
jgi:SAM-dependent methyltransferase